MPNGYSEHLANLILSDKFSIGQVCNMSSGQLFGMNRAGHSAIRKMKVFYANLSHRPDLTGGQIHDSLRGSGDRFLIDLMEKLASHVHGMDREAVRQIIAAKMPIAEVIKADSASAYPNSPGLQEAHNAAKEAGKHIVGLSYSHEDIDKTAKLVQSKMSGRKLPLGIIRTMLAHHLKTSS